MFQINVVRAYAVKRVPTEFDETFHDYTAVWNLHMSVTQYVALFSFNILIINERS